MVTNRYGVPQAIVNFASKKEKKDPVDHRYSVTELLQPTREIKLTRKHYNEIEEDVSDLISALFGSAVHKLLEENADDDAEVKFEVVYGDDILVGVTDLITEDAIEDYKTATVTKVLKGDFEDYKKQGLIYAWLLFKKLGDIKRKIRFHMLLKDWSKIKAYAINNYPKTPIYTYEYNITDSDFDYIENYIREKLKDIKSNELSMCSDKEKWYTGDKYAVYKKAGDKKATAVLDSEQEAHDYITNKCDGSGEIQVRKGECLKCKYYCKVAKFCEEEKNASRSN